MRPGSFKTSLVLLLLAFWVSGTAWPADLELFQLGVENPVQRGGDFEASFIIANQTAASADSYRVEFFASRETVLNDRARLLGSFDSLRRVVRFSFQEYLQLLDSCLLEPGDWFFFARVSAVVPNDPNAANDTRRAAEPLRVEAGGPGACAAGVINAGLNDAWFNPDTPGQGVFITVLPEQQQLFLAWFTFSPLAEAADEPALLGNSAQRWLTAIGPWQGRRARLVASNTRGGLFAQSRPPVVRESDYGALELELIDCERARLRYELPAAELDGVIALRRVVPDNVALCQALAEMASDQRQGKEDPND